MKTKFILFATCLSIAAGLQAQKGIDNGTTHGSGEDSVRCLTNISLFISYAQSNNFRDAYPFWKLAYDECPASHLAIYQQGIKIYGWMLEQEADPAKKEAIINDLMTLYDNRIKYFNNDPRNRKDAIVRSKVAQYNQLKGENTNHELTYKWLSEVLDEFKENTDAGAISYFMFSSYKLMQGNMDKYKIQYVNDFMKCSAIIEAQYEAAIAANNTNVVNNVLNLKREMEQNFATSGAADCEMLQNLFAAKVEENKNNLDVLKEVLGLLSRIECNQSDLYFTASEYAYKIEPTFDSAQGLGLKAFKENDYATAEKYFNEAVTMAESPDKKAVVYFMLANIAYSRKQYQKVKQEAMRCLSENPNFGKAYILIGTAYASSASTIYPDDPVKTKCVYYAVVDKFEKARQVEPTLAEDMRKQIANYSQYFPTKEEVFMHPDINSGENFTIGGWINETVRIR